MDREKYCREIISSGSDTFVLMRNGEILRRMSGRGVRPMLATYSETPELMKNAEIFDKVIGKAAAMVAVLGGVRAVYGQVMSLPGKAYLEHHGITPSWGELVPAVVNRTGDDMCPLEKSVCGIEDPAEGIAALRETVARLMAGK